MTRRESKTKRTARTVAILEALERLYPDADCALTYTNPFQLLIATILSAQSTDETVNKVTPVLFKRFKTPKSLAKASDEELQKIVHPTGFFRQKAKNIKAAANHIVEKHGGELPRTIAELTELPGVARKTANVVLGTAFGLNEGIVVDTHIGRLAVRLGLATSAKDSKDAVRIEKDLMEIIPQASWTFWGHALIHHGRAVCKARKPDCTNCELAELCPSAERC